MWGIGAMTGPLIGSILYKFFGFEITFYIYGAFEILLGTVIWFKIKNSPIMKSGKG